MTNDCVCVSVCVCYLPLTTAIKLLVLLLGGFHTEVAHHKQQVVGRKQVAGRIRFLHPQAMDDSVR